ncbi:MAG: hypothetical protein K2J63_07345 [Muribaculaceae bacterium]|nr:hypothetical protein [Muribaculaceae bacterium]MDE6795105.1 hypothetical protein [Muribaculaceae bacterium]
MTDKFKESLDFVVKYYRRDAFQPDDELFRVVPVRRPWWQRTAIAASVAVGVLAASAFLYVNLTRVSSEPQMPEQTVTAPGVEMRVETEVKRIEFKDATLKQVAEAIEATYGVEVEGIEANGEIKLTLSYEGTAEDLVETINELLDTSLRINESGSVTDK